MSNIYNRKINNSELRKYLGSMSQVCGIKDIILNEGLEKGTRALYFRTGSGLNFFVLPDRGMDIGIADFKDSAISWISSTSEINPAYFEHDNFSWLRGFFGGLLTTCGLSNVGPPNNDSGENLGLHGRISYLPAREVCYSTKSINDSIVLSARGKVVETQAIKYEISMNREIEVKAFDKLIKIKDEVKNEGFDAVPLMILYHINFGFPIVHPESVLILDSKRSVSREGKEAEYKEYGTFHEPSDDIAEEVYRHEIEAGSDGFVKAGIYNKLINDGKGLGVFVRARKKELPYFWQWKYLKSGIYVSALEPANCQIYGRNAERKEKRLEFLKPGEKREFVIEIGLLDGEKEYKNFLEDS